MKTKFIAIIILLILIGCSEPYDKEWPPNYYPVTSQNYTTSIAFMDDTGVVSCFWYITWADANRAAWSDYYRKYPAKWEIIPTPTSLPIERQP